MGTVIISLDTELGWGFHDVDLPEDVLGETPRTWTYLRDLFDTYDVPATWAIAGHLLLDSCERRHSKHPAGERCCERSAGALGPEDVWFEHDLVDDLEAASVDHEIAAHGFTHVHFQHECMDAEFAARELEHCVEAAADRGLDLTSFVFPVNRVGYRDLLADHGFDCYRGVNPAVASRTALQRQVSKLSSATIGTPTPPIVDPDIDEHGLVDVPASLYLFNFPEKYRKPFSLVGEDPVTRQARAGIDEVAETDGVLHLWLHPHNLREPHHFERLRSIVSYLDDRRNDGDLRIDTMAGVASRTREEHPDAHTLPARD